MSRKVTTSKVGDAPAPSSAGQDLAIVYGKDQHGLHILRRRSEHGPVEAGVIHPLTEGKPITGEVVSLLPRPDMPFVFDVKTELAGPARPEGAESDDAAPSPGDGPSQVASDAYRKGWDKIWGGKRIPTRHLN